MRTNPFSPSSPLKELVFYFDSENSMNLNGYDDEIRKIIHIISKRQYTRNVLIYGNSGVGKSSIIYKLVSNLSSDSKKYKSFVFFDLDVTALLSKSKKNYHLIFQKIADMFTLDSNRVLIIDDVVRLLTNEHIKNELIQLLKTNTCIIATLNQPEDLSILGTASTLFEKICLSQPHTSQVYDIIKYQIHELEVFHGVKISKETANWCIYASSLFNSELKDPKRSLVALDGIMCCAKQNGHSNVRKSDFFSFYSLETKRFKEMTYEQKLRISIHEIGHLVAYLSSECLSNVYTTVAVTCIPYAGCLGRTSFDMTTFDFMLEDNESFYIALMVAILAGKVSEEIFGIPANSGAREDLQKVNQIAIDMATIYGFNPEAGDMVLLNEADICDEDDETDDYEADDESICDGEPHYADLLADKIIDKSQDYIQKILAETRTRAENLLRENKDLIATLADILARKGILTKTDIDKLVQIKR